VEDVVNQPADFRFVIDRLLRWDVSDRPFLGGIDPLRRSRKKTRLCSREVDHLIA